MALASRWLDWLFPDTHCTAATYSLTCPRQNGIISAELALLSRPAATDERPVEDCEAKRPAERPLPRPFILLAGKPRSQATASGAAL